MMDFLGDLMLFAALALACVTLACVMVCVASICFETTVEIWGRLRGDRARKERP